VAAIINHAKETFLALWKKHRLFLDCLVDFIASDLRRTLDELTGYSIDFGPYRCRRFSLSFRDGTKVNGSLVPGRDGRYFACSNDRDLLVLQPGCHWMREAYWYYKDQEESPMTSEASMKHTHAHTLVTELNDICRRLRPLSKETREQLENRRDHVKQSIRDLGCIPRFVVTPEHTEGFYELDNLTLERALDWCREHKATIAMDEATIAVCVKSGPSTTYSSTHLTQKASGPTIQEAVSNLQWMLAQDEAKATHQYTGW